MKVNISIEERKLGEFVTIDEVLTDVQREVLIEWLSAENDTEAPEMLILTKNKKVLYDDSQGGLSLNTIIIAVLVIMVFVILIMIFTGQIGNFVK